MEDWCRYYFYTWRDAGVWEQVHDTLRRDVRKLLDREETPSAGDHRQPEREDDRERRPEGVRRGEKRSSGRKRHVLVDTLGLIWGLAVLPASSTDWGGAVEVFRRIGGGVTSADDLIRIGEVAKKYKVPMVKFTGGQRLDLLGIKKEDLPGVWRRSGDAERLRVHQGAANREDVRRQ